MKGTVVQPEIHLTIYLMVMYVGSETAFKFDCLDINHLIVI